MKDGESGEERNRERENNLRRVSFILQEEQASLDLASV